jgi:diguanylate cyclase (GGDEF)-like protein
MRLPEDAGPARARTKKARARWLAVGERADDALARSFLPMASRRLAAEDVHSALALLARARFRGVLVAAEALAGRPRAALRVLKGAAGKGRLVVLSARKGGERAERAAAALGIPRAVSADEAFPGGTEAVVRAPAPDARLGPGPLPRADGPGPAKKPLDPARFSEGCLRRVERVKKLCAYVLRAFAEASGATRVSLMRRDPRDLLVVTDAIGLPAAVRKVRHRLGSGIAGRAAIHGRPVLGIGSRGGPRGYGGTAYVVLPLVGRASMGSAEGVLCLSGFPEDRLPDDATLRAWARAARDAGRALRAARRLQRAEALSTRDRLTRLPNRRAFWSALKREVSRAERGGHEGGLAVAVLDVDHFKRVNDAHGHPGGDQVLVQVARRLQHALRESDLVARLGGEEFAVLLLGIPRDRPEEALRAAERLRAAVDRLPMVASAGAPQTRVTVSGGVATWPKDGTTAAALYDAADRALYRAKQAGRNRVEPA